ncbi:MAG: hypothetical protein KKG25_12935 [Bacteroidetes bacterium]|nr:hypothetical protein [Bacteroidota bacterium]MBU1485747.1 hypothetical protein [Bacteroidota bacterium]MBU2269626.1 hypothetical protein [Bacteroidota bacterium]MBU2376312.1 hypothetical protein [Bacteroidota bacterium]
MKKIIVIISLLFLGIIAVTWLYFKSMSGVEGSKESVFKVIPDNASLVFEYKNENSFYDIFKDFGLFKDVLGNQSIDHLGALKRIFVDDKSISGVFNKSDLFFSIHQTGKSKSNILIIAPFGKDVNLSESEMIELIKTKYKIIKDSSASDHSYQIAFSNQSNFHFYIHQKTLIGSFNKSLVEESKAKLANGKSANQFKIDFTNPRNRNSIANLYINFAKLPNFLNNFSSRKNPEETFSLKSIDATASLNINYQSNAFMFSGITEVNQKATNYFNLFLNQQPGQNTLRNIIPNDAADYSFFYISDFKRFRKGLDDLFILRKESEKLKTQLDNIKTKHSINIDEELLPVLANEFGVVQLASGDKIGIVKTNNTNRLSFLLSTISSPSEDQIRHFDDSFLLYYFLGDPFKYFRRPYYAIVENHLIVANNNSALKRFLNSYKKQDFLIRTDKNIDFQQYLSNQGNIFYFIHNSNSKAIISSFLNSTSYTAFKSDDFKWKDIYGLAIQFSADKDRFFTNLYMSKIPDQDKLLPKVDSLMIDSITQSNKK